MCFCLFVNVNANETDNLQNVEKVFIHVIYYLISKAALCLLDHFKLDGASLVDHGAPVGAEVAHVLAEVTVHVAVIPVGLNVPAGDAHRRGLLRSKTNTSLVLERVLLHFQIVNSPSSLHKRSCRLRIVNI